MKSGVCSNRIYLFIFLCVVDVCVCFFERECGTREKKKIEETEERGGRKREVREEKEGQKREEKGERRKKKKEKEREK